MEDLKSRRYVMSLENTIDMNCRFLGDIQDEFRDGCKMVGPGKPFPPDVVGRVRRQYKEIRDRLAEIRAVQQLLKGKYRRAARRNPVRDKKIDELGFAFKNYYSSFEFNLRAIERLKRKSEQEERRPQVLYRIQENNLKFKEGLKLLGPGEGGYHSISVVFLRGDKASIDAHGEESESRRIKEVMGKFLVHEALKSVKCAIFRVEKEGDLRRDVEGLLYQALDSIGNKELKVVR
jgi:hypothetical protein